jgi:CBS-domain-containing membrane protein
MRDDLARPGIAGKRAAPAAQRASLAAVLVVLPGMLALLEFASSRTDLKMLLFPPLAAIGYQVLRTPHSPLAHLRSVVLAPTLASVIGTGLAAAGGLQVWTTAAATLAGVVIVELLRAHAPPALAVALLPLFSRTPSWIYPVSVVLATTALYGLFLAWRHVFDRLSRTPGEGGPGVPGRVRDRARRRIPPDGEHRTRGERDRGQRWEGSPQRRAGRRTGRSGP